MRSIAITLFLLLSGITISAQNYGVPTNTLPIVEITTENGRAIDSKEEYISAQMTITDLSNPEMDYTGNIQIRGRGNHTWTVPPKKPYKIKLEEKTSLLGAPANKHWALMAHWLTKSGSSNFVGFEMGRLIGLGWQPHMFPVEVILNGKFIGLYFLQETVRIGKGRLNIFEQDDQNTDPEILPYGWLVEVDNTINSDQVIVPEWAEGPEVRITPHSPEDLSTEQREWLENEFIQLGLEAYENSVDDPSLFDHLDIPSLAKYSIVRDMLFDGDAYYGSFYFHKDKGETSKWKVGPLWDCTLMTIEHDDMLVYSFDKFSYPTRGKYIQGILRYPRFWSILKEEWENFYPQLFNEAIDSLKIMQAKFAEAMERDWEVWPAQLTIVDYTTTEACFENIEEQLRNNATIYDNSLNSHLASIKDPVNNQMGISWDGVYIHVTEESIVPEAYDILGRKVNLINSGANAYKINQKGLFFVRATSSENKTCSIKIIQ